MPAVSMRPNRPPKSCWFDTPMCTMATIGSAWFTRPEARGQFRQAADCYRSVVEFARADPENYDPEFVDSFLDRIAKLEASAAKAQGAVNNVDRSA